jgi:hypothetical protein
LEKAGYKVIGSCGLSEYKGKKVSGENETPPKK